MNEPATALLSVQGEARMTVAPDSAVLAGALRTPAASKAAALSAAAEAQHRLTADLAALGGVPLAAGSERQPLTWSAYSATTEIEYEHDPRSGYATPTGQVIATVSVSIMVRDFGVLDRLGDTLAGNDAFSVHHVAWLVDADNPSWPDVRAAAIHAAIAKGRDYAAALGGELVRVEHIADAGLLGGGQGLHMQSRSLSAGYRADFGGAPATPSLDPVTQELVAAIDARFVATVAVL